MKLCDLDQRVIVPVVDETRGGIQYEMQMSIGELLGKALEDFKPEIVEAVPVAWLKERKHWAAIDGDYWAENIIKWLLETWQKEREVKKNG